jgi:hypothetical protein
MMMIVESAERGATAWRDVELGQQGVPFDRAKVSALATQMTHTMRAIQGLAAVLAEQITSTTSHDAGEAVAALNGLHQQLDACAQQAEGFRSAVEHLGRGGPAAGHRVTS